MSEEEEGEYDAEGEDEASDAQRFADARKRLESRCLAASISLREEEYLPGECLAVLAIANGKEKRDIAIGSAERIDELLALTFERYVFLGSYDSIASYTDGTIEGAVRPLDNHNPIALFRLLLGGSVPPDLREVPPIELPSTAGVSVSIGLRSREFAAFLAYPARQITIKVSGLTISQHDQALDLLERLSSSIFLQIDMLTGVPLTLVRRRVRRPLGRRPAGGRIELRFPTSEYDSAPLSLFWYARGAVRMPLLQFLAYYQVLEFYFPVYSQAEAQRRVQQILRDPTFRPEREADVNRVLSAAKISGSGGFGDERSQLRATLNECVDAAELRMFLIEDEHRKTFFATKAKGLTSQKLQIDNATLDLRNDVADRIYDIRCKIVHTKSGGRDGEVELLLPFSSEAEMLYHDIELLGFIAIKVLIAASSPLRL